MAVVFAAPAGTAVGLPLANTAQINVVSIIGKKVGSSPQATISQYGSDLGATATGPPGSINDYLNGLGIVVGLSGQFRDSLSVKDAVAFTASVNGRLNSINVQGVAFHRVITPANCATPLKGHGIEAMLAYFQDNRFANPKNAGRYTTVRIANTALDCAVIGLSFKMMNATYNLWSWNLELVVWPLIDAGGADATLP